MTNLFINQMVSKTFASIKIKTWFKTSQSSNVFVKVKELIIDCGCNPDDDPDESDQKCTCRKANCFNISTSDFDYIDNVGASVIEINKVDINYE